MESTHPQWPARLQPRTARAKSAVAGKPYVGGGGSAHLQAAAVVVVRSLRLQCRRDCPSYGCMRLPRPAPRFPPRYERLLACPHPRRPHSPRQPYACRCLHTRCEPRHGTRPHVPVYASQTAPTVASAGGCASCRWPTAHTAIGVHVSGPAPFHDRLENRAERSRDGGRGEKQRRHS